MSTIIGRKLPGRTSGKLEPVVSRNRHEVEEESGRLLLRLVVQSIAAAGTAVHSKDGRDERSEFSSIKRDDVDIKCDSAEPCRKDFYLKQSRDISVPVEHAHGYSTLSALVARNKRKPTVTCRCHHRHHRMPRAWPRGQDC